jgi:pyridoxal phosphate enzyme (YggS family)
MSIAENVAAIRERLAAAARRAGRNANEVLLMGVSKTFPADAISEAYAAGIRVFGENRVQEFGGKFELLSNLRDAEWHLIGHLQSNKASKAAELFHAVDSVDSLRLAERLDSGATAVGKKLKILIEINIGGEAAKSGLPPDSPDLEQILNAAPRLEHLEIRGLMTIPPFAENPEDTRPYFRKLRELRNELRVRKLPGVVLDVLSMGMSHDFEVAIEEGSTCVRVGTGIFGVRR